MTKQTTIVVTGSLRVNCQTTEYVGINLLTSSGLPYHNSLVWSISNSMRSPKILLLLYYIEIYVINVNIVVYTVCQILFWGVPNKDGLILE